MGRNFIAPIFVCLAIFGTGVAAQTPSTPQAATQPQAGRAAMIPFSTVEGQTIEKRAPGYADEKPAFPQQTRAPYHATAPFKVTTLLDNMRVPYSMAFLPDGKILMVFRLPGEIRLLDKQNVLSQPLTGLSAAYLNEPVAGLAAAGDPPEPSRH